MILEFTKEENDAIQTVINLNKKILKICTDPNIDYATVIDERERYTVRHLNDDDVDEINDYLKQLQGSYIDYDFLEEDEEDGTD